MDKSQELLLHAVSQALFGVPDSAPLPDEVLAEAKMQSVVSLITNDYQAIAANIRCIAAHTEITRLLEDIPFTTFKGFASAFYYSTPEKRMMGDVDFIVPPEYYQAVKERLFAAGWEKSDSNNDHHEEFFKQHISFELHSDINGVPKQAEGISTEFSSVEAEAKVKSLLADLIDTSITIESQQGPIQIPDEFHHGLIMLLHVAHHMIESYGIGLRHLCDWAVYVHQVDLEQYRDRLEGVGLWTFARQLTAVSSAYLGLPEKVWAGEWPDAFLKSFVDDILSSGNFGRKRPGRRSALVLAESSYVEYVKKLIPVSRKYKVLLPFAMVIAPLLYVNRMIHGRSKPVKLSTISEARRRVALYNQFQLFQ